MAGSTIYSIKRAKDQASSLHMCMNRYQVSIDTISARIKTMMAGDGKNSYWQGRAAYVWYSQAISYLDRLINNYNLSFKDLEYYAVRIERADLKNRMVGARRNVVASYMASCTGKTYTAGLNANEDNKRIKTVASTVNPDSVNDDRTSQSFSAYKAVLSALDELDKRLSEINNVWVDIASNTTGVLYKEANNRLAAIKSRKQDIRYMRNTLEEQYIGSLIFSN